MRQHAHTLACAYGAGDWVPLCVLAPPGSCFTG
jgi:hypothetical protein